MRTSVRTHCVLMIADVLWCVVNSVDYNGNQHYTPMSNATLINNTSIAPWGGKGIGIYGGSGHLAKDNYMSDTARYVGLGMMKFGVNGLDLLSATVTGNTVVRSGGNGFAPVKVLLPWSGPQGIH